MLSTKENRFNKNQFFKITTEASNEPVSVSDVKNYARIDGIDEDSLLELIIKSVRISTEKFTGLALITQSIRITMDEWNQQDTELIPSPVQSVTSVQTVNADDSLNTIDSDNYNVITETMPSRLILKNDIFIPLPYDMFYGAYRINYIAGYGDSANDVPATIRMAIIMWSTYIYETRNFSEIPPPEIGDMLYNYKLLHI